MILHSSVLPSSSAIASATVGASSTGVVFGLVSGIPEGTLYAIAIALIGLLTTLGKGFFETRAAAIENRLLRDANQKLEADKAALEKLLFTPKA